MNYLTYIPIWEKLNRLQQNMLMDSAVIRRFRKGEILHNGADDCTGLILVVSGQLRAFTISDEGRSARS